jgi:hypothetical protein
MCYGVRGRCRGTSFRSDSRESCDSPERLWLRSTEERPSGSLWPQMQVDTFANSVTSLCRELGGKAIQRFAELSGVEIFCKATATAVVLVEAKESEPYRQVLLWVDSRPRNSDAEFLGTNCQILGSWLVESIRGDERRNLVGSLHKLVGHGVVRRSCPLLRESKRSTDWLMDCVLAVGVGWSENQVQDRWSD